MYFRPMLKHTQSLKFLSSSPTRPDKSIRVGKVGQPWGNMQLSCTVFASYKSFSSIGLSLLLIAHWSVAHWSNRYKGDTRGLSPTKKLHCARLSTCCLFSSSEYLLSLVFRSRFTYTSFVHSRPFVDTLHNLCSRLACCCHF